MSEVAKTSLPKVNKKIKVEKVLEMVRENLDEIEAASKVALAGGHTEHADYLWGANDAMARVEIFLTQTPGVKARKPPIKVRSSKTSRVLMLGLIAAYVYHEYTKSEGPESDDGVPVITTVT